MIEIKVTVEMPGIPEALTRLADALAMTRQADVEAAPVVEMPAPRKRRPAKDKAEDHKPVEAKPEALPAPTQKDQAVDLNVYAVPQVNPTTTPVTDVARAGVQDFVTTATTTATEAKEEATPAKVYTLEQISKAGLALMDAGRLADLMGLLAKYGLQSLTAADPKQYAAIAEDLIAMGGTIPEVG